MKISRVVPIALALAGCLSLFARTARSRATPAAPAPAAAEERPLSSLPYTPSLDLQSMDRSVNPCVDFYGYACGGWIKHNPIPPDQASWSVYHKLADENQRFLWGALEQAAAPRPGRSAVEQKTGDYFAACMDEAAIDKRGVAPIAPLLRAVGELASPAGLAPLLGTLATHGLLPLFGWGSGQDFADASSVIAQAEAGGLGLPDRDYYTKTDPKSVEIRGRYVQHVARMLQLSGEPAATAKAHADKIMAFETALAKSMLTRVERRDPHNLFHKMAPSELQKLTPSFHWDEFAGRAGLAKVAVVNVGQPRFFAALDAELGKLELDTLKAYLRWHVVGETAPYLSKPFVDENFAFYSKYLRGVTQQRPRWKRCVRFIDRDLGEALGQVFVQRTFGPELKRATVEMTRNIEKAMEDEIKGLTWMGEATKKNALVKLHAIVNKVGYPDKWRDYSAVEIKRDDFAGDVERAGVFEWRRELAKIGKPLDRGEWDMTPPTVNAYYNPQMNDINFPAGVLQPPLYDFKMDDAPNYGNTGSTIGHELTHGFDDEGRQFDARGDLKDWWTANDAKEFEKRAQCVVDQYAQYTVVDDIKINSKLTEGEDVADLGGTVIAYLAWKRAVAGKKLAPVDGLAPDQRYFVGMAQWACDNERPENLRANAITDPHSPSRYRVNGVVANMPEFAAAFACKAGQPMVRATPCKVW